MTEILPSATCWVTPKNGERMKPASAMLPHGSYINAVADALAAAGLKPEWRTEDTDPDWWATPHPGGVLAAVLTWAPDHPGATNAPDGLALLWEHRAPQWRRSPLAADALTDHEPAFLTGLGRYADPAAVVAVVHALLTGEPLPEGSAPEWPGASAVRQAVDAWAAAQFGGEMAD